MYIYCTVKKKVMYSHVHGRTKLTFVFSGWTVNLKRSSLLFLTFMEVNNQILRTSKNLPSFYYNIFMLFLTKFYRLW